jgi:hypothetical protein
MDAPTQRPLEPVTAGLPIGAGPGPEALGLGMLDIADDAELEIREMIRRFPEHQNYLVKLLDYYL